MRVNVDVDVCRTAGQCVVLAPDVVDQSAEAGRVIPLAAPAEALAAGVREGHRRLPCPAPHPAHAHPSGGPALR
ncbi:ferredoxin [Actinoalloteichus caeruleus]|uniref:ferredoxin n=1 Tax=Actinoalloteichus cyanogriseus TaxID=2893586 RepID=UPI003AB0141A